MTTHYPSWPQYTDADHQAVARVIKSNQLFAAEEVRNFEAHFARFTGAPYAIGVMNATAGLHLALAACDIGAGAEVIVTPYSWISTASCILMQNAIPVFADIDVQTLSPGVAEVEKLIGPRTRAVIVTHIFGYPADVVGLSHLCNERGLVLIEDCSHAPGLFVGGDHVGLHGNVGVFSLHQRKAIPVGDGGILITRFQEISERLVRLRSFGHNELSYNYRMTEFAGALGVSFLSRVPEHNQTRRRISRLIGQACSRNEFFTIRLGVAASACASSEPVYYSLLLELADRNFSRAFDLYISKACLPIRRTWAPLNEHPHFSNDTPCARGRPWASAMLPHDHQSASYSSAYLPNSSLFQKSLIFEILINPFFSDEHISALVNALNGFHPDA